MKSDKKLYKICDRCDHGMSNKLLKEKLKRDIVEKAELITEEKTLIENVERKIYNIKLEVIKKSRQYDS